jgi:hypothetical protein
MKRSGHPLGPAGKTEEVRASGASPPDPELHPTASAAAATGARTAAILYMTVTAYRRRTIVIRFHVSVIL